MPIIKIPSAVKYAALTVRDGVAVLTIRDFSRVDGEALAKEIEQIAARGVERLLFDLRGVAAGTPRDASGTASLFASGTLFTLRDRAGKTLETVPARPVPPVWRGPTAVLVNGATAGAAEGVAELLRTSRGASVFGEPTYGLGAEARLIELPDGAGLLIPSAVWEAPGGKRWNGDGITPDRVIRTEAAHVPKIHSYAEPHAPVLGQLRVACLKFFLCRNRALYRIHHAVEL